MKVCPSVIVAAAVLGLAAPAAAGSRLALLVAHDEGGAGQQRLAFSRADAERMRAVLTELGGFATDDVRVLDNPKGSDLESGLDWLEQEAANARDAGQTPMALFYYSGHARATSLSLGPDEVGLDRLRSRLGALPASVKLVILDACQSGEFSSVKGAEPVEEFALSSIDRLDVKGLAVLASSTGSELSQESDHIAGSYFTHHLVSGLWGPADADDDGRVSLEEAYGYAYDRTVLATAATRVGRQHPTLELEVRGHGQLVLTQPRRARSVLAIPPGAGESVLIVTRSGQVWGEVEPGMTTGAEVAIPAGTYALIVRKDGRTLRCPAQIDERERTELDLAACVEVDSDGALPKQRSPWWRDLGFDVAVGLGSAQSDAYIGTLFDFGYDEDSATHPFRYALRTGLRVHRNFEVSLGFENLAVASFTQRIEGEARRVSWDAHGVTANGRALLPLFGGWFIPYLEAGAGIAWARVDVAGTVDHHTGLELATAGGLRVMFGSHVGIYSQLGWVTAPVIRNDLGEVHDVGGVRLFAGLRVDL